MFNPKIAQLAAQSLKKPAQKLAMNFLLSKLSQWKEKDPKSYNAAMSLVSGKTDEQQKALAEELSAEYGIDIMKIARTFGYNG